MKAKVRLPDLMRRQNFFFAALAFAAFLLFGSCTPEEEMFKSPDESSLYFSLDSLSFDTLLSTTLSPTYRLFLHNAEKSALIIPSLKLRDPNSPFTLTVQGERGKQFSDIKLLGGDSLLILVEASLAESKQTEPILFRDYIELQTSGAPFVVVEAWGQDASFINELIISGEQVWDSPIPYVVKSAVLVDTLSKLTIKAGVEIIMDPASNFFVKGTLVTEGSPGRLVTFRNARTDPFYREAPGQWGGIYFLEGSKNNLLQFTLIKNGEVGLRVGTPDDDAEADVTVANCIIANMSSDGILAFTSDLNVYNTLIYNAGRYLAANLAGGNYFYNHCTLTNFPNDFFREDPSIIFSDNIILANLELLVAPLNAFVSNSVVWGNRTNELEINTDGGADFVYQFKNNLLKTNNSLLESNNNLLNISPRFQNELLFNYQPDSLSPLIDAAAPGTLNTDLSGLSRDSLPDIGAYEWRPAGEENGG